MKDYAAVRFSVRPHVVAKLLSQLYGLMALVALIPGGVTAAIGSPRVGAVYAAVAAGLGAVCAAGLRLPAVDRVQRNEAAVTVALVFVTSSLAMTLPLTCYGIAPLDAWFEATSGVTTTGLSTLAIEELPPGLLFARGWLQWVGGIGVVVLALAVLISPGHAAKSLGFSKRKMSDTVGGTRAHARRVIIVYLALTAAGISALVFSGAGPLDAFVHAMTAVSTGGFANHADSLAGLPAAQIGIVHLLCLAGAVSFHVYYLPLLNPRARGFFDSQLFALLGSVALVTLVAGVLARFHAPGLEWRHILTMVVSAQTTAGFSTVGFAALPAWFVLILCAVMLIGGGLGSTAGGIKISRALMVFAWIRMYLIRTSTATGVVTNLRVGRRRVDQSDLEDLFAVVGCFAVALFVSWLVFVVYGYPPLDSLFEVTSALATAGLSTGITSADLPAVLKVVLGLDMLFGRLEVVALLILVLPRTWIGRRRASRRPRIE